MPGIHMPGQASQALSPVLLFGNRYFLTLGVASIFKFHHYNPLLGELNFRIW
jgi:hypothetical protein